MWRKWYFTNIKWTSSSLHLESVGSFHDHAWWTNLRHTTVSIYLSRVWWSPGGWCDGRTGPAGWLYQSQAGLWKAWRLLSRKLTSSCRRWRNSKGKLLNKDSDGMTFVFWTYPTWRGAGRLEEDETGGEEPPEEAGHWSKWEVGRPRSPQVQWGCQGEWLPPDTSVGCPPSQMPLNTIPSSELWPKAWEDLVLVQVLSLHSYLLLDTSPELSGLQCPHLKDVKHTRLPRWCWW